MIGQKQLLKQIDNLLDTGFPQFVIIVGEKGSGKKTVANYIASKLAKVHWTLEENKIANVRHMIEMSYNNYQTTMCIIPEADTLMAGAQNALLKIVEEPPKNTYFIMTLQDINYILPTIKSRAFVLIMDPYTKEEINEYVQEDEEIWAELCENPGECDLLKSMDVDNFVEFVDKVVDNIPDAGTANIFKIGQNFVFKEGDKGYDLKMFFKCFMRQCLQEQEREYIEMALKTGETLRSLRIRNVNKQMLFNNWIIEMRKIWK